MKNRIVLRKKIIHYAIGLVLVAAVVLAVYSLTSHAATGVGMPDGAIAFSDKGEDITSQVGDMYPALEDDSAALYISTGGVITYRDKKSGATYSDVAGGKGMGIFSSDSDDLDSSVILHYLANGLTETTMYSSVESVDKNQYRIYKDGDTLGVEYILGEKTDSELLPPIISPERVEKELLPKLDEEGQEYLGRRYQKYFAGSSDVSLHPDDKVLEKFPILKTKPFYVLVSANSDMMRQRTTELLQQAGYTKEDMIEDEQQAGYENKANPLSFKVVVEYRLDHGDLVATIPADGIRFYRDNPLVSVEVLKYFTSTIGRDGYYMIPSGDGALMSFGKGWLDASYQAPVLGKDAVTLQASIPYEMQEENTAFTLPMYGMNEGNTGVMAILESGAPAATFHVLRREAGSTAYFTIDTVQHDKASIGDAEPITVCGAQVLKEDVVVRYRFLSGAASEDAGYSAMAAAYRQYLQKAGLLSETAVQGDPRMVAETVGAIHN